ncbi:MAG: redoxin domain-containing protein [Planctomycetaceae bacterium]|nr:redoxin domain-containing protein [Planctomycetaceae bacterium]
MKYLNAFSCILAGAMIFVFFQAAFAQQKSESEIQKIRLALVSPSQKGIDVDTLTEAEIPNATLIQDGSKGFTLKNPGGVVIRKLYDANGSGSINQWSFFKGGIEVYRDIDTDQDKIPDQMRWLNTAGTRWGIDSNKDGVIDYWKSISPEEVSEEVVIALVTRDFNRFLRVALDANDLKTIQCGPELTQKLTAQTGNFNKAFQDAVNSIKLSPQAEWGQSGALRPSLIPQGDMGNTADLTVYPNVVALINNGENNNVQILIGAMVKVGDVWKVTDAPMPFTEDVHYVSPFERDNSTSGGGNTEEITQISKQIQELEEKIASTDKDKRVPLFEEIAKLRILAALSFTKEGNPNPDPESRDKWLRDMADFMYTAVTVDNFPGGIEKMRKMADTLKAQGNLEIAAYMQFKAGEAEFITTQATDPVKAYADRLKRLEQLVKDFPNTTAAARVLFELVNDYEMSAQTEKLRETVDLINKNYPNTLIAEKAAGVLRRIDAAGKPFAFQGRTLAGSTIDVNQYKGKIVLLYFWSAWADPKGELAEEMKRIQTLYERDGLSIIGVNLDDTPEAMTAYLTANPVKFPQIHEQGGLDGRPAVYAGINVQPFFILLDKEGKAVNTFLMTTQDADRAIFELIRK